MNNFNEKLAVFITKHIGTMWCVLYFLYVQEKFRKVLEQRRKNRHMLGMAWSKNKTRLWSWFLGGQRTESSVSSQESLSIIGGRDTRGLSYRPSMQKSTLCEPRAFRTSNRLREQSYTFKKSASRKKLSENSLSTGTRIYGGEHLPSKRQPHLQRLQEMS